MSWCRWSSMDFACDLYVYDAIEGVVVHVGGARPVFDRTQLPPPVSLLDDAEAWLERHNLLMRLLETAETVPIDLPHAGDDRTFDTLAEAADWIDELTSLGYVVPEGMTAEMRADAAGVGS